MLYEKRVYDAITSKYVFTSAYDVIDDAIENDKSASYDLLLAYKLCVYIPTMGDDYHPNAKFEHYSEMVYSHMNYVPDNKPTLERAWGFAQAAIIEQYRLNNAYKKEKTELYYYLVSKAYGMLKELMMNEDDFEFYTFGMSCYIDFFLDKEIDISFARNCKKFNECWDRLHSMKNLISVYIKRCIAASIFNYVDMDLMSRLPRSLIRSLEFSHYFYIIPDTLRSKIYSLIERKYISYGPYEYCNNYDCELCQYKEKEREIKDMMIYEWEKARWEEEQRKQEICFDLGKEYNYEVKERKKKEKKNNWGHARFARSPLKRRPQNPLLP